MIRCVQGRPPSDQDSPQYPKLTRPEGVGLSLALVFVVGAVLIWLISGDTGASVPSLVVGYSSGVIVGLPTAWVVYRWVLRRLAEGRRLPQPATWPLVGFGVAGTALIRQAPGKSSGRGTGLRHGTRGRHHFLRADLASPWPTTQRLTREPHESSTHATVTWAGSRTQRPNGRPVDVSGRRVHPADPSPTLESTCHRLLGEFFCLREVASHVEQQAQQRRVLLVEESIEVPRLVGTACLVDPVHPP